MPIKLMVRVLPGVELTCASFCPSRELIRLDLPTLERPRNANSGGPSRGKTAGSAADSMNLARMDCMKIDLVSHTALKVCRTMQSVSEGDRDHQPDRSTRQQSPCRQGVQRTTSRILQFLNKSLSTK